MAHFLLAHAVVAINRTSNQLSAAVLSIAENLSHDGLVSATNLLTKFNWIYC